VKYQPGTLLAKGIYAKGSRGDAETRSGEEKELTAEVATAGPPAAIVLQPDRAKLAADGADLSVVAVKIVDAAGRLAPLADDEVSFSVTGPGKILGVGNGDPSSHESDKVPHRKAFNGLCMVLVQTSGWSGVITLKAEARGLKSAVAMLRGE
jgi:beta-galactosidase